MKHKHDTEETLRRIRYGLTPDDKQRLRESVLDAWDQEQTQPAVSRRRLFWSTVMNSRIIKFASAAAILIVVLVGLNMNTTQNSKSVAWGEVPVRLHQIQSYSFRMTVTGNMSVPGTPDQAVSLNQECELYMSTVYGTRIDSYQSGKLISIMYTQPQQKRMIILQPDQKNYSSVTLQDDLASANKPQNDPRKWVDQILSVNYTSLGRDVIDGVEVEGVETTSQLFTAGMFEAGSARLWVSLADNLPVRMEINGEASGGSTQMRMVFYDFQWNLQLDEAFFEPDLTGYDAPMTLPEITMPTEHTLLEGLRLYAEVVDGKYPSSMAMLTIQQDFMRAYMAKKTSTTPTEARERAQEMAQNCRPVFMMAAFYMQLTQEQKKPVWYGDQVTPADADAVLTYWIEDDDHYRVVFGDLRIQSLTPEELGQWIDLPADP